MELITEKKCFWLAGFRWSNWKLARAKRNINWLEVTWFNKIFVLVSKGVGLVVAIVSIFVIIAVMLSAKFVIYNLIRIFGVIVILVFIGVCYLLVIKVVIIFNHVLLTWFFANLQLFYQWISRGLWFQELITHQFIEYIKALMTNHITKQIKWFHLQLN